MTISEFRDLCIDSFEIEIRDINSKDLLYSGYIDGAEEFIECEVEGFGVGKRDRFTIYIYFDGEERSY